MTMKIENDEMKIEHLFASGNIDAVPHVIQWLADKYDRNPEKARSDLEVMIWFQNCNSQFEAENGMNIDEACFRLIERGEYQPVLEHIVAVGDLLLRLPGDSDSIRFLNAYITKYLDAMDAKDMHG